MTTFAKKQVRLENKLKQIGMKLIKTFCIAALALVMASCGNNAQKAKEAAEREQAIADSLAQVEAAAKEVAFEEFFTTLPEEPVFDIVTNLGTIKVKLYAQTPLHRKNFAKLAYTGFYDGVLFHRVINGFMIQGGDPNSKDPELKAQYGKGGPGYTLPAEFIPEYKHKKGALAAARLGDAANPLKESSGSQFYLVQDEKNCAALDGEYTVYGQTVAGLEVIDKIAAVATDQRDLPLSPVRIQSVKLDPSCLPVAEEPAE